MGTSIFFPHQTVKMEQKKSSIFFAGRDEMFFSWRLDPPKTSEGVDSTTFYVSGDRIDL